jgi:predicted RNA binding protein YcfA (HicA-like mRNA interferase family)
MSSAKSLPRLSGSPRVLSTAPWHIDERVCLVCATAVPSSWLDVPVKQVEAHLRMLGWHRWHSRVSSARSKLPDSTLLLCPGCLAEPILAATTILSRHGLVQMWELLTSLKTLA